MAAKIFRINYKSDFILTLNSDAGWMTPFCIKFWTGAPSQAFFVGWDGETYTHCAYDPNEPTKLLVQFDDHHLPIGDLKFQIVYHFTVADFPNDTEDEVINPSNITTEIDGETYQVMLDFTGETAPEIEFSLPAYANEAQRIVNEQQRIANEQTRIENEQTRIQHEETREAQEQTRQQNEAQRIAQESARVSEFASLKSASEAATRDANNAATLANEKAQLAADKAALADSAATQASLSAVYAHDEGQLAGQKAIEAAQATQLATNEAAFAHDQGNYAKQQGDYAKEQGDTALADHVRAEADHSTAAADHTQAGNDHTRADSDHSTSAADHTTAGNDHTRAESDHGIAVEDHTQAGNDHTRAESDHTTAAADHTTAGNDHTRAESDHTRAESDHAAVEVYVDSLGAFDISAYHATGGVLAEYADLAAALGTNGANIPDALRKGGMSVKFVSSSDHKYVQFRCISDEFTTDVTQWAIAEEGVYIENPEFVYVKTDAENKILWAIRKNGDIFYGAGVPSQIINYINEKIAELSLDEYEDIVAFLNGLEEGENTLQQLLNLKANKANPELSGKVSLDKEIGENDEVIEASVQHIDSPEFVAVWLDKDEKILFGIQVDGNFLFGCGVPMQLIDFVNSIKTELLTTIDTKVDKVEGKSLIDSEFAASQSVVENSEYMEVETDLEDRILGGRKIDGTKFENLPMEFKDDVSFNGNIIGNTDDLEERIAMLLDSKGAILSYRDKDGFLHEEVGFDSKKGKNYLTVKNAVIAKKEGIIQVGENVVVGLKALSYPYTNKDIEDNYKVTLPAPVFPYIKSISLHRLYDDAAEPNMLYICSHSDKHIFYSICPTDVHRAVYQEGYYTKYNANYFYYANKETPSNIHKVVLPNTVDGRSMDRRITFVFEMSNGECLLEIANGEPIAAGSTTYHHNIYKVSNVFSENTLQESDFTLSLSFDYYLEKVSAFDNITEGKAGMIIAAPYWGGKSGQVYVSHNYGGTWDLIFCSNPNNTHYIKPKAEHFGEENAYGRYPTPDLLNPEGELDWDTTLPNGNSHVHGIAYDPWYDRIWIVTGDGDYQKPHNVTGIWWTDDEGYTWKRIGGGKEIGTQLIGIIPMEHCVLFPTDSGSNGFWRWSRNGADSIISIESCYNYTNGEALQIVGGRTTKTKSGFSIASFVPEGGDTWIHKGGLVATPNGFDFYKIYEDTFTEGTEETAELGWCCDVTDCGDKLIVGAYQGGYIELKY